MKPCCDLVKFFKQYSFSFGVRIDYKILIALLTIIIGLKSVLEGVFGVVLFSIIILALR
jgi:hypothetical protein